MTVNNFSHTLNINQHLIDLFDTILERQREAVGARDEDKCFVEVRGSEQVGKPIWFSLRQSNQINGQVILDKISRISNSNESFLLNGKLHMSYIHIPQPEAGGRGKRLCNETMDRWLHRKSTCSHPSLFDPKNEDNMCLTRCVAFAQLHRKCYGDKSKKDTLKQFKAIGSKKQKEAALNLCEQAGINPEEPCGLPEIQKLQDSLPNYRLVVFTDQKGKEIIFKGPLASTAQPRQNIHLLWHEAHFYAILTVTGAFGSSYFCEHCLVLYSNKGQHKCEGSCWRCCSITSHEGELKRCHDCARHFAGDECFEYHKSQKVHANNKTTCETKKFCPKCEKSYTLGGIGSKKLEKHICGKTMCSKCKLVLPDDHPCYFSPWEPPEKSKNIRYMRIYYDIETTQSDQYEDKNNWMEHKPNTLICQQVCEKCEHVKETEHACLNCGDRENIFEAIEDTNKNVVSDFIEHLLTLSSEKSTVIHVYAHNARAFDSYFILQELISRKKTPEIILQGAKIISMKMGSIHFRDSLLFLPQKLSALPKAFGLTELRKGYFPHLANRKEFYEYIGPMPDKELYCTSTMSVKDKKDFETWYDEQVKNNYQFNFKYELFTYCQSDVDILRQAMESFRALFMEIGGFDPLHYCLTLSSACMAMYRYKHMPLYSIGLVPHGGYRGRDKQSYIALQWLDFQQHLLGNQFKIQTAENSREVKILGRPVDGFVKITKDDGSVENTIFQFHGCYFHMHDCHKNPETRKKLLQKFGGDRLEKTRNQTEMFRRNGYTVIEKWECEFNHELKHDPDTMTYFAQHPVTRIPPLNLRDGLCGGRTSALHSYKKADLSKGEKIKFYDVCSEYPFVNFKKSYCSGHPEIFLENDPNMPPFDQWNGMIKATVLPPRNLFLPVLPYKCCSKLMFPLCRTCTESQNQNECIHDNPENRYLTGTWCAPELHLAVKKGYTIIRTHEVYQYPGMKQYDPITRQDGLFSSYVRTNMAMKVEASGWPSHVKSEEDKNQFIKDMFERDGIIIQKDKVEKNPGKRFLAKLILNSFCKYLFDFVFKYFINVTLTSLLLLQGENLERKLSVHLLYLSMTMQYSFNSHKTVQSP